MNLVRLAATALAVFGLVVASVNGGDANETTAVVAPDVYAEGAPRPVYVGTKKCRMCHTDQYDSWRAGPKGDSWDALAPGYDSEVKRRVGLDPDRDYTQDATCLPCHAVGYGEPGGYTLSESDSARAKRRAAARQGTGCECCHGPGSEYVKIMREVAREQRHYVPDELQIVGLRKISPATCTRCHTNNAPCAGPTDVEARIAALVKSMDRKGYHEKFPLKYRKEVRLAGYKAP